MNSVENKISATKCVLVRGFFCLALSGLILPGCSAKNEIGTQTPGISSPIPQEEEIRKLIEELVFAEGDADNQPVYTPGVTDTSGEYSRRYRRCLDAFSKLTEFADSAFPLLVAHLDDKRQSINFRNHCLDNSVGDACYWIMHNQLMDKPRDYSEYGYQRIGRDGQWHVKPYWKGSPFTEAGGIAKWLDENKNLTYPEKRIKCLQWLLEREKAIGACDAASYFLNIMPLEIRILERRLETGADVAAELDRMRSDLSHKNTRAIPPGTLPENISTGQQMEPAGQSRAPR